jgi:hypothetical protein
VNKNQEILSLAEEIMLDITNNRIHLYNILLKASRLSLLIDLPDNVKFFKEWAKYAEQNQFIQDTFQINMQAATSANVFERNNLRTVSQQMTQFIAHYRTETYDFALGIYTKWKFGNIAETVFEKKRKKVQPILLKVFPDINQRFNSIEQNLNSANGEDWKNAITSCRTLLMDIADLLNPPSDAEDKGKYINRLKEFISPKLTSDTKISLMDNLLEEIKSRIELTVGLTQGGAHKTRPTLDQAEDVVLYTYLILSELMVFHDTKTGVDNSSEANPLKS